MWLVFFMSIYNQLYLTDYPMFKKMCTSVMYRMHEALQQVSRLSK